MKVLARLQPRDVEGADQVLEGVVAEVASGNQVRVWPAMSYDPEVNQTRIGFITEWRRKPTPNDIGELLAFTNGLMGKPPDVLTETTSDPGADHRNVDWLRTGKVPRPERAN